MEKEYMYYSKVTKQPYESLEEMKADEKKVLDAKQKEEAKKQERSNRAKEVENAFKVAKESEKKAQDLLNQFCKDYGSFHTTVHSFDDILQRMFLNWF